MVAAPGIHVGLHDLPVLFSGIPVALICILASERVHAATATGNLTVQIEIQAECEVTTTATVNFGAEGVLNSDVDAAGSISVQCTSGVSYDVGLGAGQGAGATTSDRKMTGPASATIDYGLFSDSARTTNWGDTISTDTVSGTGDGSVQVIDVYGRVPAQTTPAAGTYSDTVLVTVTY